MCDGITIGGNVSIQISGPCVPPDGSVTAAKINSGNAVDGQVLTADGNGGAAWQAVSAPAPEPALRMRTTGTSLSLTLKSVAAQTFDIDFGDLTTATLTTELNDGEFGATGSWNFGDAGPRIVTISNAVALAYLDCYNNALTALDVSGCTALAYLDCYNNALTALDVSGCTALAHLDCYNNALGSAAVDAVLVALAAMAAAGGACDQRDNAAPTATGLAAKAVLEGRGWTVNVDS